MSEVQLAGGIYWVGAIDWNIRNFHGYSTPLGNMLFRVGCFPPHDHPASAAELEKGERVEGE